MSRRKDQAEALADELLLTTRGGESLWVIPKVGGFSLGSWKRVGLLAAIRRHFHPFDRVGYMREYMRKKRAKGKKRKEAMAK